MKHIALVNELNTRMRKRRIIEGILCVLFLITTFVFLIAYEESKVVEEYGWGPIKHELVTYNYDYLWGVYVGLLGAILSGSFLIADFAHCKLSIIEVNGDQIIVYRGMFHINLYVNGEYKDGLTWGYHLEAPLSDGSRVNVALGRWSAYLTFSNGHPPMEV